MFLNLERDGGREGGWERGRKRERERSRGRENHEAIKKKYISEERKKRCY